MTHYADIFEAAREGDIPDIKYFLSLDNNINILHPHLNFNLLIFSADNPSYRVMKYLLSEGIDINHMVEYTVSCSDQFGMSMRNTSKETALLRTDRKGSYHFVKMNLLLDAYKKYFLTIRHMLKYLGLENLWCIIRIISEPDIKNEIINEMIYE